jgi:hypothetical protein
MIPLLWKERGGAHGICHEQYQKASVMIILYFEGFVKHWIKKTQCDVFDFFAEKWL